MQPQPGYWQFVPVEQPQPTQIDTRLIQRWYEWILFLGDIALMTFIVLVLLAQQIQAGWRW